MSALPRYFRTSRSAWSRVMPCSRTSVFALSNQKADISRLVVSTIDLCPRICASPYSSMKATELLSVKAGHGEAIEGHRRSREQQVRGGKGQPASEQRPRHPSTAVGRWPDRQPSSVAEGSDDRTRSCLDPSRMRRPTSPFTVDPFVLARARDIYDPTQIV